MSPSSRLARVRRAVAVDVALVRAFRRSPVDFLEVLAAGGAGAEPLRIGSEAVLLLEEPTEIWALLTAHARHTAKGRGLVRVSFQPIPKDPKHIKIENVFSAFSQVDPVIEPQDRELGLEIPGTHQESSFSLSNLIDRYSPSIHKAPTNELDLGLRHHRNRWNSN